MPLDELNNLPQPATDWPSLDPSLLGDARPTPTAAFPIHLISGRWRTWLDASSRVFGSADYLAHGLLGGVAGVAGAGIRIEVVPHWHEPLLLWQALVGGPSSGRSAAFVRVRALLDAVGPADEESGEGMGPALPVDGGLDLVGRLVGHRAQGVLLWRSELGDWMAEARRRAERPAWLASWSAETAMIGGWPKECFAVGIAGALSPGAAFGDSALASRFLYVWPGRGAVPSLADTEADDAGLVALLQKIALLAGHREAPCTVPLSDEGARRLEALMPEIAQRAEEAADSGAGEVAAEWIGRGVATVVRLAGVLSLMEWAETELEYLPVGTAHIEAAYALWADYYLPQALAVFDRNAGRAGDQTARRVVRWLKRVRAPQVSREEVRREALCQSVDADGAEEVLARLEAAGVLREVVASGSAKGGPRRRRWEVNPLLWPAVSAVSATPLPPLQTEERTRRHSTAGSQPSARSVD